MPTNETNTELKLILAGIKAQRQETQDYLAYLNKREQEVSSQLMTGAKPGKRTTAKTEGTPVRKRKRTMTPEAREKMRQAARKRWANVKSAQTAATTTAAAPINPPSGMEAATVQ